MEPLDDIRQHDNLFDSTTPVAKQCDVMVTLELCARVAVMVSTTFVSKSDIANREGMAAKAISRAPQWQLLGQS